MVDLRAIYFIWTFFLYNEILLKVEIKPATVNENWLQVEMLHIGINHMTIRPLSIICNYEQKCYLSASVEHVGKYLG
jgi:hypothetical protein